MHKRPTRPPALNPHDGEIRSAPLWSSAPSLPDPVCECVCVVCVYLCEDYFELQTWEWGHFGSILAVGQTIKGLFKGQCHGGLKVEAPSPGSRPLLHVMPSLSLSPLISCHLSAVNNLIKARKCPQKVQKQGSVWGLGLGSRSNQTLANGLRVLETVGQSLLEDLSVTLSSTHEKWSK